MEIPKELTHVTPFSRIFAFVLFILIPCLGFFIGMEYQKSASRSQIQQTVYLFPAHEIIRSDTLENEYIMRKVLVDYFDTLKKNATDKIVDYKINKISEINTDNDKIHFKVIYSVKPDVKTKSDIFNGVLNADGWILNNSGYIEVMQNKDGYFIDKISETSYL